MSLVLNTTNTTVPPPAETNTTVPLPADTNVQYTKEHLKRAAAESESDSDDESQVQCRNLKRKKESDYDSDSWIQEFKRKEEDELLSLFGSDGESDDESI